MLINIQSDIEKAIANIFQLLSQKNNSPIDCFAIVVMHQDQSASYSFHNCSSYDLAKISSCITYHMHDKIITERMEECEVDEDTEIVYDEFQDPEVGSDE